MIEVITDKLLQIFCKFSNLIVLSIANIPISVNHVKVYIEFVCTYEI